MNISDLLVAFFGGLASGIVLLAPSFIFRLLRRRAQGELGLQWNTKELRALLPVSIGFILIFLALFVPAIDDRAMGIFIFSGLAFLGVGVWTVLS